MSREEMIELRRELQNQKAVETAQIKAPAPTIGEVPGDLLGKIFADLEERTGNRQADFTVVRGEAVQWNDGSMGCAEPGQAYTQGTIDGYWIVIDCRGKTYDYRVGAHGYFKLCPGFMPIR